MYIIRYSNVHYQVLKCTQMHIIKSYLTLLKVGNLLVEPHICDYLEYCKLDELVDGRDMVDGLDKIDCFVSL